MAEGNCHSNLERRECAKSYFLPPILMVKLAREVLKEPTKVRITHAKSLHAGLCAIVYMENDERIEDLFNVATPEIQDTLEHVQAGKNVEAVLEPDDADSDGHPRCTSAEVVA